MAKKLSGITIKIDADASGLDKALSDVNTKASKTTKELREVNTALKFNPGNTELLAQKQKLLSDQVATTKEKLDKLKEAEAQVQEQFKKGEISQEQYREFQRELIETESKLKHYESQLASVNKENNEFTIKMNEMTKKLGDVGTKMSDVGKDLSKKVTAPLATIGGLAVKVGMDFEAGMSNVKATSGATAGEMQKLEKAARDAGRNTTKSATDAADALGYMSLAGWDVNTSISGLMPVLRLSEAGNIELAKASSLVTDSMSAMGVEVKDLPKYLDVVAQTARSSNTDIDQLAEAYIKVGGTLRGLNVPVEESAVALGMLANAGIKGNEAGTALNAVMNNLTAPTGRAKEALSDLGFSAFDSQGNFKGLENVLFDLKDKLAGMTEEQKNTYLSMIGGKEHVKDLNALLNGLDDSYDDLKKSVSESDGALEEMAKTMQDNAKGSLTELKSALEELAIKIYDVLSPIVSKIIEKIQAFVDKLDSISPKAQKVIVIAGLIVAGLGPVLIITGKLISSVGLITNALSLLNIAKIKDIAQTAIIHGLYIKDAALKAVSIAKTVAMTVATQAWNAVNVIATVSVTALGAAVAFLTSPIGIAIIAIGAIIAAGVLLYKNWDYVKEKAQQLGTFLQNTWDNIKNFTADLFKKIGDAMLFPITKTVDLIKQAIDGLKNFFSNIKLKALEIPKPKIPKFKLTGEFSLKPPSVPRIDVEWNAQGAIFTKPYVFGNQGFGEAGPEAVLPISKLAGMMAETLDKMNVSKSYNNNETTIINQYAPPQQVNNLQIGAEKVGTVIAPTVTYNMVTNRSVSGGGFGV